MTTIIVYGDWQYTGHGLPNITSQVRLGISVRTSRNFGGRLSPSLMDGPRGPHTPKKSYQPEVVGKPPIIGLNWT